MIGLRDAGAARAAQRALWELSSQPELAAAYARLGVTPTRRLAAYAVGDVEVDTMTISLGRSRDEGALDPAVALGPAAKWLRALMTSHVATAGDVGYVVYGEGAQPVMTALLEGKIAGGLHEAPAMKRALAAAPEGTFLLALGAPDAIVRAIAPEAAGAPPSPTGPAETALSVSVGAGEHALRVVLDLPAAQLLALARLATR